MKKFFAIFLVSLLVCATLSSTALAAEIPDGGPDGGDVVILEESLIIDQVADDGVGDSAPDGAPQTPPDDMLAELEMEVVVEMEVMEETVPHGTIESEDLIFAQNTPFINNPYWIITTTSEIELKRQKSESMIVMYYDAKTNLRSEMSEGFNQIMNKYQTTIYGINTDEETMPIWLEDYLVSEQTKLPIAFFYLLGDRIGAVHYEDQLQMIDKLFKIWIKPTLFESINQGAMASYDTSPAALQKLTQPTAAIQSADPSIIKLAQQITSGASNDLAKLEKIHDWVADTIYYDWPSFHGQTARSKQDALSVLEQKYGVCDGYTNLTAALCRAVGIPCKYVSGIASSAADKTKFSASDQLLEAYQAYLANGDYATYNSQVSKYIHSCGGSAHAWNVAYINGRWITLDVQGDSDNDLTISGGQQVWTKGTFTRDMFDQSLQKFSNQHCTWYLDTPVVDPPDPPEPPTVSVPTGVKVTPQSYNSLKISWNQTNEVDGYYIYRAKSGGKYSTLKKLSGAGTTSYIDKNLGTGDVYYYRLLGYKVVDGTTYKSTSAKAVGKTVQVAKPSSFKATGYAGGKIRLTWTKATGAHGYLIQQATTANGSYKTIKTLTSGNTVSFTNTGLKSGNVYYYKLTPYRTVSGIKKNGVAAGPINTKAK